jgi:hypothetical protein
MGQEVKNIPHIPVKPATISNHNSACSYVMSPFTAFCILISAAEHEYAYSIT